MKVETPLGSYPFEFRRLERRRDGVAIVGLVAGLESSLVLGSEDLRAAARVLAPPLAAVAFLSYLRRRAT